MAAQMAAHTNGAMQDLFRELICLLPIFTLVLANKQR